MDLEKLYELHKENTKNLYQVYCALKEQEIYEIIDKIIQEPDFDDEQREILLYLALFSHSCGTYFPKRLYQYLLKHQIFNYFEVYLRAEEEVADEIITLLETWEESSSIVSINQVLCALVCIPCKKVKDFLQKKSKKPLPLWAKHLFVLPIEYSNMAGWTVNKEDEIEFLYDKEVTAFSLCKKEEVSELVPFISLKQTCSKCGEHLTLIYNGDLKLVTCLECSCYETLFFAPIGQTDNQLEREQIKKREQMQSKEMINYIEIPFEKTEESEYKEEYYLKVSEEKRLPIYTISEWPEFIHSQIGGIPTPRGTEINYPICPNCNTVMKFKAQFDLWDVDLGEGIYYFFECKQCKMTACNYAQT